MTWIHFLLLWRKSTPNTCTISTLISDVECINMQKLLVYRMVRQAAVMVDAAALFQRSFQ